MTRNMRVTWLTDDSIRVQAVTTDFDGDLYEPDNHLIVITDPLGSVRGSITSVDTVGTGTYKVDYCIPEDAEIGSWKISWKALVGTVPAREIAYFEVAEG
jgi:hypothetical protein